MLLERFESAALYRRDFAVALLWASETPCSELARLYGAAAAESLGYHPPQISPAL